MAQAIERCDAWKSNQENWVYEKKTYEYRERDEAKRRASIAKIADYKRAQLVFVDETGAGGTCDYPYGYCHHSERFHDLKLGHISPDNYRLITIAHILKIAT